MNINTVFYSIVNSRIDIEFNMIIILRNKCFTLDTLEMRKIIVNQFHMDNLSNHDDFLLVLDDYIDYIYSRINW